MICARRAFNENGCRCPECGVPKGTSNRKLKALRNRVIAKYGDACYLCGVRDAITLDHVIPRSKGGRDALSNLRPCCFDCNRKKADTMPVGPK